MKSIERRFKEDNELVPPYWNPGLTVFTRLDSDSDDSSVTSQESYKRLPSILSVDFSSLFSPLLEEIQPEETNKIRVRLQLKDKSWVDGELDRETMTVSDLLGKENRNILWINNVTRSGPHNIRLDIEEDDEPVNLYFFNVTDADRHESHFNQCTKGVNIVKREQRTINEKEISEEAPERLVNYVGLLNTSFEEKKREQERREQERREQERQEQERQEQERKEQERKEQERQEQERQEQENRELEKREQEKAVEIDESKGAENEIKITSKKEFKQEGALFLQLPNEEEFEATIDLSGMTIRSTSGDRSLNISSLSHVEWEDSMRADLTLDDDAEGPVKARFTSDMAAEGFRDYWKNRAILAEMAEGNPSCLQVSQSLLDPLTLVVLNTETNQEELITFKDEEEVNDFRELLAMMQKTTLKSLQTMGLFPASEESMDRLTQVLKMACPESFEILHGSKFIMCRCGDDVKENGIRMSLQIRKGVFGLVEDRNAKIPPQIHALKNFHDQTGLLELNGTQRGAPAGADSYMLTLGGDEPRRIEITGFETVIEKRAFGDLINIVSFHSYATQYEASLTLNEIKVSQQFAAHKRSIKDDTIRMKIKKDKPWSKVHLSTGKVKWAGRFSDMYSNQTFKGLAPFPQIEEFVQLENCHVDLKIVGLEDRIKINMMTPKLQQLFSAYCSNALKRRVVTEKMMQLRKSQQSSDTFNIFHRLQTRIPSELSTLARAEVEVEFYEMVNSPSKICHFNLICNRIYPDDVDRTMRGADDSMDLFEAVDIAVQRDASTILKFKGGDDDFSIPPVRFKFRRIAEGYSLWRLKREFQKIMQEQA